MTALSQTRVFDLPLVAAGEAEVQAVHTEVLRLFDEQARSLHAFVRSSGLTPEAADDVVQETFVALYRHLRRQGDRSNLRGWLFRVAYRTMLKHRRKIRRLERTFIVSPGETELVPGDGSDPEARVLHRERCRQVRAVMAALPEQDRQCFYLRAEGLRYRQIAETLGVSLGAVAKSMARGMARVARAIREESA